DAGARPGRHPGDPPPGPEGPRVITRTSDDPVPVVYDVNVLVGAVAGGNSPFRSWPSPPPTSGNPFADCLGIAVDAAEFALWLSPHLMSNTERVLHKADEWALDWDADRIEHYLRLLTKVAVHSGGGLLEQPPTAAGCPGWA